MPYPDSDQHSIISDILSDYSSGLLPIDENTVLRITQTYNTNDQTINSQTYPHQNSNLNISTSNTQVFSSLPRHSYRPTFKISKTKKTESSSELTPCESEHDNNFGFQNVGKYNGQEYNKSVRYSYPFGNELSRMSLSVEVDEELQLVGKAIRHVYTPSWVASLDQELNISDSQNIYMQDTIKDTNFISSLRLQKSKSWSKLRTIERESVTEVLPIPRYQESIIFSDVLEKRNRYGHFQKRFDGILIICLSESREWTTPKGTHVCDFDLSKCKDSFIADMFSPLLNSVYPAGSHYHKLAQSLIADELIEYRPNPFSTRFHVPKWIIPCSSIIAVKINEKKNNYTYFSIITDQKQYRFRARPKIAEMWIFLLDKSTSHYIQRYPPPSEHQSIDELRLSNFAFRINNWNRLLLKFDQKYLRLVTTIYISDGIICEYQGLRNHDSDLRCSSSSLFLNDKGPTDSCTTVPTISDCSTRSFSLYSSINEHGYDEEVEDDYDYDGDEFKIDDRSTILLRKF